MPAKLLSVVSPDEITRCATGAECMQARRRFRLIAAKAFATESLAEDYTYMLVIIATFKLILAI